jgi:hypothetical protein
MKSERPHRKSKGHNPLGLLFFANPHSIRFDAIVFYLRGRTLGAEVPLLADNFSRRATPIRSPSQRELLGALPFSFDESQPYATYCALVSSSGNNLLLIA